MNIDDRIAKISSVVIITSYGCWKSSSSSLRIDGKMISMARAVFEAYNPNSILDIAYTRPEFRRTCGNSWCVNPKHLYYASTFHRFWEKVDKRGDNECWEWKNSKDGGGYGCFIVSGRPYIKEKAHRYSWFLANGPIPDGMQVLHHCDNPSCVNPDHLFLGTNLDNVRDKMSKGRAKGFPGKENPNCRLSESDVREIMSLHNQGWSYRKLMTKFPVGNTQIGRIIRKESWAWLWD